MKIRIGTSDCIGINSVAFFGFVICYVMAGGTWAEPVDPITDLGLYNTGVDDDGVALVNPEDLSDPLGELIDAHWVATLSPDPSNPAPPDAQARAWAILPVPPWVENTETSRWISAGAKGDGTSDAGPGEYTYRTTFNTRAVDASTLSIEGQWAADDFGDGFSLGIQVNGEPNFQIFDVGFGTFEAFTLDTGFVMGENTIDFFVLNGGEDGTTNPHGIHVQFTSAEGTFLDLPGVPGDYNGDFIVDAADYTVWRDNLGASIALPNEDPSVTPGMVTAEDYTVWKMNFGNSSLPATLAAATAVPEPASIAWLLGSMVAVVVWRSARR